MTLGFLLTFLQALKELKNLLNFYCDCKERSCTGKLNHGHKMGNPNPACKQKQKDKITGGDVSSLSDCVKPLRV